MGAKLLNGVVEYLPSYGDHESKGICNLSRIEFTRSTPESLGISSSAIASLLDELEKSPECEPHALMVMRHGQVCAEGWWSPFEAEIPHSLWSLSKTYTGTAIGLAYTDGLLDLDDRLIDYFPEFVNVGEAANADITIRHALTMTTGKPLTRSATAGWRKDYFEIPFNAQPGTKYEYSCDDNQILVAIIEKVTGQSLHDYLSKRLFEKIGIVSDEMKWIALPDGSEVGCGGLLATAENSLRLMKLYLDGGTWAGERLLAADFVAQASVKQVENSDHGYGFQIHIGSVYGSFYGAGSLGQLALVVPDLDMVIVLYQTGIYRSAGQPQMNEPGRSAEYYLAGVRAVFRTLLPEVNTTRIPENRSASAQLTQRLTDLTLGSPRSVPLPLPAKELSRIRYRITEGTVTIRDNLWNHVANREPFDPVAGCQWFSFEFDDDDTCMFRFCEHGEEIALEVGLDGNRRLNSYSLQKSNVDKVLLDGAWLDDETFALNARWVETCYSISLIFKLTPDSSSISLSHVDGDYGSHPLRGAPATAVAF